MRSKLKINKKILKKVDECISYLEALKQDYEDLVRDSVEITICIGAVRRMKSEIEGVFDDET